MAERERSMTMEGLQTRWGRTLHAPVEPVRFNEVSAALRNQDGSLNKSLIADLAAKFASEEYASELAADLEMYCQQLVDEGIASELITEELKALLVGQPSPAIQRADDRSRAEMYAQVTLANTVYPEHLSVVELVPGSIFEGRYRIVSSLGRGGMGSVWQATQFKPLNRDVAIKVLARGFDKKPMFRRFELERDALARIDHPNIVRIFDSGESDWPYIVMELVRGVPVDRFCRDNKASLPETAKLFTVIADAVAYAHSRAIVHRDLKPSNILVDQQGTPKIIDFGLVHFTEVVRAASHLTLTGQFIGSLPYASPEQCSGKLGELDTRTDVYSLGATLWTCLFQQPPHDPHGPLPEVLARIMEELPKAPQPNPLKRGRLADDLLTICLKCLRNDPKERYASAGAVADDLRRAIENKPLVAEPPSALRDLLRFARRNRRQIMIWSALLLWQAIGTISTIILLRQRFARR